MDGKSYLRQLRLLLSENIDSDFLDARLSYEVLFQAASDLVKRTAVNTGTQVIKTILNRQNYALQPTYIELYLKDPSNEFFIKINNGQTDFFVRMRDREDIAYMNNNTAVPIADGFFIKNSTILNRLTGVTTTAGADTAGECQLTDSTADFSDAFPGDIVHNTTDGASGIVLKRISNTILLTALFDGTSNDWALADAYVIQPQSRFDLVLSQPPSVAGYNIIVDFIERPDPVFSDYGVYPIPSHFTQALVNRAAWIYKYRDKEPNFGDIFNLTYERMTRDAAQSINSAIRRPVFEVSMKKRR